MNKYEEALNSLVYVRRDENNKPIDIVVNDFTTVKGKSTFQMRLEFIDTLQELVKRATPMKPIENESIDLCPVCKKWVQYDFCRRCGQAIDWSDK